MARRRGSYLTIRLRKIFIRAFPSQIFRQQASSDWQGEFPLPHPVAEFYVELGPSDAWIQAYGNPYFLPCLSRLWNYQAGYRYNPDTHEPLSGWDDDWLAIADQGYAVFIFSRASAVILHAYHGGPWRPEVVFRELSEMVTIFAILGDIVESAGQMLTDDTSIILPRYREEAHRRIGKHLQSTARADALLRRLEDWD